MTVSWHSSKWLSTQQPQRTAANTTSKRRSASNTNVQELLKTQLHLITLRQVSDCLLYFWFAMALGVVKAVRVYISVGACAKNLVLLLWLLYLLVIRILLYRFLLYQYRVLSYTIIRFSYCATMLYNRCHAFSFIPSSYHIRLFSC